MGVSIAEFANQLIARSVKVDEEIESLWSNIESATRVLSDTGFSNKDKFSVMYDTEYLVYRLRVVVETELSKVKMVLANDYTPATLKPMLTKRNAYLGDMSNRIASLQNDAHILSRFEYATHNGGIGNN